MKLHPRVTRSVVELVKRFEGLRRRAARLPDGGWTVGYGHTRSAREGAVVSAEDADALLYYDLSEVAEKVEAWTFTPLSQNQFEALIAFAFNIGVENFHRSTVLKHLNEGQYLRAAASLELWRKADFGGENLVIDALVRRRAAEKAHFLTPPEGFRPSPSPVLKPIFDYSVIEAAANAQTGRAVAMAEAPPEGEDAPAAVQPTVQPVDAQPTILDLDQAIAPPYPETVNEVHPSAPTPTEATQELALPKIPAAPLVPSPPLSQPGATLEFTAPPRRPFSAPEPSRAFEAPFPFNSTIPSSLFDAPSVKPVAVPSMAERPFLPDAGLPPDGSRDTLVDVHDVAHGGLLTSHNRWRVILAIGLFGVALVVLALFSMFGGKASAINLVIGLMGILLMMPAGGYLLLLFFNQRDGLIDA